MKFFPDLLFRMILPRHAPPPFQGGGGSGSSVDGVSWFPLPRPSRCFGLYSLFELLPLPRAILGRVLTFYLSDFNPLMIGESHPEY